MFLFRFLAQLLPLFAICLASNWEPIRPGQLTHSLRESVGKRSVRFPSGARRIYGRSDGSTEIVTPKVFIISLFTPEAVVWQQPLGLFANNVTVPGLSPLFPDVFCNKKGSICQVVTGEGEINAASTSAALIASPLFDLTSTYFFIAGIAGVNPACGTIGSVSLARYAVQVGLEYEIDIRELTKNYTSRSGYIPLGQNKPKSYPIFIYGSEVFELSKSLRHRAFEVMKHAKLDDSDTAKAYRARYPDAPANEPPKVFKGVVACSDVYYHGALLGDAFSYYIDALTNGTGRYCMTAQEDNAILASMLRGALADKVDFTRIVSMRTAANFDRPPPGESPATQLFFDDSGGFPLSTANIYNAGKLFVSDVIDNWDSIYKKGIKPTNYVGDIFGSLKGPFPPDIGSPNSQQG